MGKAALAPSTIAGKLRRFFPLALASTASWASAVTFLRASLRRRLGLSPRFESSPTWLDRRRCSLLILAGFCAAEPFYGRFCRKCPALERASPQLGMIDSSQDATALILASFAVNALMN